TTEEVTAEYDAANQLTRWGNTSYEHDQDGNRLSETSDSGTAHYSWDARGRLTSIVAANGDTTSFNYDFAGNLARIATAAGEERQLIDELTNVVFRRTADGTTQSMLSGQSIDHQLGLLDSKHGARYPLLAMPNSTVATVAADGTLDGQYSYEPY